MLKLLGYLVFNVLGLIVMKAGMSNFTLKLDGNNLLLNMNLRVILGLLLYGASFIMWMGLLKKNDLSYIYPIATGLVQISIMIGSRFFLGDPFTIKKILGSALIMAGIGVMNI